ncbi:hypothetical protein LA366_08360 [Aeromonas jandaei]|uniref:Uncharacterized protein n=1 Tax=Aeromonas jandaei TaxID=650 RepID=A0A7T4AAK5_AERJA|nr:hypothetical protein [Aeromonas jandaei]QQB20369.1 hypothetical protein I6H43_02140 [Aeromonas jandaei]UCA35067.1 hypothetical protein LA366_08360 [Aeromonas jandaei]
MERGNPGQSLYFHSTIAYFSALYLHKQPFHRRLEYRLFIPQSWLWQEKNHIQSVTTPKWLYAATPHADSGWSEWIKLILLVPCQEAAFPFAHPTSG